MEHRYRQKILKGFLWLLLLYAIVGCAGQAATPTPERSTSMPTNATEIAGPASTRQGDVNPEITTVSTRTPADLSLTDPAIPLVAMGTPGWEYYQMTTADLDGDGTQEQAVLIAKVLVNNGQPLWDSSQPWQAYIEESDGTRTYVYNRNLHHGRIEALLTTKQDSQRPAIVLLQRAPAQLIIYEVDYRGPDQTRVVELIQRNLNPAQGFTTGPN